MKRKVIIEIDEHSETTNYKFAVINEDGSDFSCDATNTYSYALVSRVVNEVSGRILFNATRFILQNEKRAKMLAADAPRNASAVFNEPVNFLLSKIAELDNDAARGGYACRLGRIFRDNDIETVGDLLAVGSRGLLKLRGVGRSSIRFIDKALLALYHLEKF